jgi:hypothetical protein
MKFRPKEVGGEECEWHSARQPTLENLFLKQLLRARASVGKSSHPDQENSPSLDGLFTWCKRTNILIVKSRLEFMSTAYVVAIIKPNETTPF